MTLKTIVDAGPLVAMLDSRDQHHEWTVDQLDSLDEPMLTCETVLCEATFLLRKRPQVVQTLLDQVYRGYVVVSFDLGQEITPIQHLMHRYANVPMSLADACLVRMSELHADSQVFTLDSDFHIYRRHGRHVIPTLRPER